MDLVLFALPPCRAVSLSKHNSHGPVREVADSSLFWWFFAPYQLLAPAGQASDAATASGTYATTTNGENMKISAELDQAMPLAMPMAAKTPRPMASMIITRMNDAWTRHELTVLNRMVLAPHLIYY